jgi:DNA polymerase III sliding clamp (beta) subunit (PCNA family)
MNKRKKNILGGKNIWQIKFSQELIKIFSNKAIFKFKKKKIIYSSLELQTPKYKKIILLQTKMKL